MMNSEGLSQLSDWRARSDRNPSTNEVVRSLSAPRFREKKHAALPSTASQSALFHLKLSQIASSAPPQMILCSAQARSALNNFC